MLNILSINALDLFYLTMLFKVLLNQQQFRRQERRLQKAGQEFLSICRQPSWKI
jgi:hypothetical protein